MGEPTGFLDYERRGPIERAPGERVGDWDEYTRRQPDDELARQGARCMDCGVPFCHAGRELAGRTTGCPLHNRIPDWNELVRLGRWREAQESLLATNNLPAITGRVCPAPCEAGCVAGLGGDPVAIKSLEQAIADRAFEEGWMQPRPPPRRTGRRVCVVGSGPAGLACADQLNRAGHLVTVYERADRLGGLLTYGIPRMKLPRAVVERRVELMAAEGVRFECGVEVGTDYPVERLLAEHDAAVLCVGATAPRDLAIDGRELIGVHFAMELLRRAGPDSDGLTAADRNVVVIGGGDTGTDCVATALRQGCRSVAQLEIAARPPDARGPDNPWPEWPDTHMLSYGQAEAAARFGGDPREYAMMTRAFHGDDDGRVASLETITVRWAQAPDGTAAPAPIPGTERSWDTDMVLLALGFHGPEMQLPAALGVATQGGRVRAGYGDYRTSLEGIFAAGDARRGQSLVVWAIHEGRGAARQCDEFLMGRTRLAW